MAKGTGTTKNISGNWESGWNPAAISGWSKDPHGRAVSPLQTKDMSSVNRLRDGLMQNNSEYKGISLGNYDGRVVIIGASSAKVAQEFVNDLQVAEKAQREVDNYLKHKKEITNEVRKEAREIVSKYEKQIKKKLWIS